ncbi:DUF6783 domain-containing protein [[Clostridium] symbiosum]|uniref:DUF6783 domain-containing protein n=1 Tax=Clostridium symbiosum TaxID=1512 RepID=UPI003D2E5D0F
MYVTICGRFGPNERGVVGYGKRIRAKSPAKWGMQMAGMNFQTRSSLQSSYKHGRSSYRPHSRLRRTLRRFLPYTRRTALHSSYSSVPEALQSLEKQTLYGHPTPPAAERTSSVSGNGWSFVSQLLTVLPSA